MVAKWLTKYNLSAMDSAPNLSRARQRGCLRHIAHLYFVQRSITEEGYHDYISVSIDVLKYLATYLLKLLPLVFLLCWIACKNFIPCFFSKLFCRIDPCNVIMWVTFAICVIMKTQYVGSFIVICTTTHRVKWYRSWMMKVLSERQEGN